jgi:hypothetical protein
VCQLVLQFEAISLCCGCCCIPFCQLFQEDVVLLPLLLKCVVSFTNLCAKRASRQGDGIQSSCDYILFTGRPDVAAAVGHHHRPFPQNIPQVTPAVQPSAALQNLPGEQLLGNSLPAGFTPTQ